MYKSLDYLYFFAASNHFFFNFENLHKVCEFKKLPFEIKMKNTIELLVIMFVSVRH